jgi:hypothetical protein
MQSLSWSICLTTLKAAEAARLREFKPLYRAALPSDVNDFRMWPRSLQSITETRTLDTAWRPSRG